jgi:hypothetical protein
MCLAGDEVDECIGDLTTAEILGSMSRLPGPHPKRLACFRRPVPRVKEGFLAKLDRSLILSELLVEG